MHRIMKPISRKSVFIFHLTLPDFTTSFSLTEHIPRMMPFFIWILGNYSDIKLHLGWMKILFFFFFLLPSLLSPLLSFNQKHWCRALCRITWMSAPPETPCPRQGPPEFILTMEKTRMGFLAPILRRRKRQLLMQRPGVSLSDRVPGTGLPSLPGKSCLH